MRGRVLSVAAGVALSAVGLAFAAYGGGVAHLPAEELRSAYPGYDEIASWDFMAGEYDALRVAGKNPQLIFGSSELKSKPAGPAHPGRLFADGRYGAASVVAGRAGVNDLWQAIELGAFAPRMPHDRKRAVVFVSMQWFMCYRDPQTSFPGVFSQGAYDAFMENDAISSDVKHRVAERVRAYGVPDAEASSAGPLAWAVDSVDRAAAAFASDMRLATAVRARCAGRSGAAVEGTARAVEEKGSEAFGGTATRDGGALGRGANVSDVSRQPSSTARAAQCPAPDWETLIAEGRERSERASRGNDYGFYDSWYRAKYQDWLSGAQKNWRVEDGAFWSAQEFEDFELMLEVCRQAGIEPLVVIQPAKGAAYDQTIYTREVRARYYDMVRSACAQADVRVADFSDREYDPLFLRDYSHPSAYGSACYSQVMWEFWTAAT